MAAFRNVSRLMKGTLALGPQQASPRASWLVCRRSVSDNASIGQDSNVIDVLVKEDQAEETKPKHKMSIAMQYYLEKKRSHDAFMVAERSEFELGKKHLANMMGMDASEMTQEDIDKAIAYLFPSGLAEESANVVMKPPDEIFERQKDAEFDSHGRPFQPFFYTATPLFHKLMYDIVEVLNQCYIVNDRLHEQGKKPDTDLMLKEKKLAGTRWISKEELEKMFLEEIKDAQYEEFIKVMERLTFQHFSYKFKDFIFKYRKAAVEVQSKQEFIQPIFDDRGSVYVEYIGQRKSSCAKVRVTKPGTGKITIRHIEYPEHVNDITYFYGFKERHQILYPLQFTKLLGLVDVDAIVYEGGASSQAGAIRYAMAMCLRSFVDENMIDSMSVCGLLTQNIRVRERKKPGQAGARRKFTWLKR